MPTTKLWYDRKASLYHLRYLLRKSDDDEATYSTEGTQQGDPMGPLLFALAYHPALQHVQTLFPDCVVIAYLDDTYIVGPPERAYKALKELQRYSAEDGLHLQSNTDKAEVHAPKANLEFISHSDDIKGAPHHPTVPKLRALKVLGSYVGDPDAVCAATRDLFLQKLGKLFKLLKLSDSTELGNAKQLQNVMTRFCANTQPNFWLRTSTPTCLAAVDSPTDLDTTTPDPLISASAAHDEEISRAIYELTNAEYTPNHTRIERAVRQARLRFPSAWVGSASPPPSPFTGQLLSAPSASSGHTSHPLSPHYAT